MVDGGEPGVDSRDEGKHTGRNDLNISVQAANLSDCRIESNRKNRFGSENRIESKLFCPNWNALVPGSMTADQSASVLAMPPLPNYFGPCYV